MKDLLKYGAIGAGIFYLYKYLQGRKEAMQNLKYAPISISIDSKKSAETNFQFLHYRVKIKLINNEFQPVIVRNIDLKVLFEGDEIGQINKEQDFIVPGRGTQTIELLAAINTLNAISSSVQIVFNWRNKKPVNLQIVGYIDTDLGAIPVKFTKKIL